jgi:hypothetical protein
MKIKFTLLLFGTAGILFFNNVTAQPGNSSGHAPLSSAAVELKMDMRKLWEDHITWTRNVIFNIIDELPGTNEAVARLLQNQVDIGDAIEPYYGATAGNQLTALLTNHILIAANLLTALDDGDSAAFSAANTAWFANADSIAMFLNAANPTNWSFQQAQDMMYDHLNFTAAEALARKNADYPGDVIAYDNVHNEILEMADFLSDGIIRQFPNRFHGNNRIYVQLSNGVMLNQNAPNPFVEETEITYFISEEVMNAQMLFYNAVGKLIKSVPIETRGEGSMMISAANLQSGVYSYSIIADGKLVETKQMVK